MNTSLNATYLNLELCSPLMVAACPLTSELDVLRRIEDQGVGAAVLPSLFEEQISERQDAAGGYDEFQGISPHHYHELMYYNRGPSAYLRYITQAKRTVKLPIIASLNGMSMGSWVEYASRFQEAGADALELNLMMLAGDQDVTSNEIEDRYVEIVSAVCGTVNLPVAIKLGPYFTALPHFAARLAATGADGLVLFNRYLQPDLNLATRRVVSHLSFSTSQELSLTLRWIGILHGRSPISLAASGGVQTGIDMLKAIAVGADAVQVASVVYRQGVDVLGRMLGQAKDWLSEHDFPSIEAFRGTMSQLRCSDPAAFARANYTKAISSFVTDSV